MKRLYAILVMAVLLLTGCGSQIPDKITENSIIINENGSLKAYIFSDFEKEIYKTVELYDMAAQEAEEYCKKNGNGKVVLDSVELSEEDGSKVCVVFEYASSEDYENYNEGSFFYGLVSEVKGDVSGAKSVKNNASAESGKLSDMHIIITDEKAVIYCPYKITYVSDGVEVKDSQVADTTGSSGSVIIIMGK